MTSPCSTYFHCSLMYKKKCSCAGGGSSVLSPLLCRTKLKKRDWGGRVKPEIAHGVNFGAFLCAIFPSIMQVGLKRNEEWYYLLKPAWYGPTRAYLTQISTTSAVFALRGICIHA